MSEQKAEIVYADLRHDCETPDTSHLPNYGDDHQVMAKWKCPICGSRWAYAAAWLHYNRMYWTLVSKPSRRWRKAEARRLRELSSPPGLTAAPTPPATSAVEGAEGGTG